MDLHVCQIAVPAADDIELSWVARQSDELNRASAVEAAGNEDFFEPVTRFFSDYRHQEDHWRVNLAVATGIDVASRPTGSEGLPLLSYDARDAGPEGRLLAVGFVGGSTRENLGSAEVWACVDAAHRRHGIATALSQAVERIARAHGRTTLTAWSNHRTPAAGEETLRPPSGAGAVPVTDAAAAFLAATGYALQQCEQHSVMELAGSEPTLDRLWSEALPHADGYRIDAFTGRVPDEAAPSLAALFSHFTEQVPTGGLDVEPEVWDVERLRRGEARREARGDVSFTAVAVHEATGTVVAESDVLAPLARPVASFQQVTVVDAHHRGHRLGLLVKIANARQILASEHDVARIHTWNADENDHMLSINRALGYEQKITEGAWQKKLG